MISLQSSQRDAARSAEQAFAVLLRDLCSEMLLLR